MLKQYHKIKNVFMRDEKTKKLTGEYSDVFLKYLENNMWDFTEKIDGTNIRIYYDGNNISIHGRTDKSVIPAMLLETLETKFCCREVEQLFEQKFGDKEVTLYGEGYGDKIQACGSEYLKGENDFILFDVQVNDYWLTRENVVDVANYFGIKVVPIVLTGTLKDGIEFVKTNPQSTIGTAKMEGVVARPEMELLVHGNERVICKIKYCDVKGV